MKDYRSAAKTGLLLLFFSLATAVPALSQYQTSTVLGLVQANGIPVPNARIEWTQDGQLQSLLTDSLGRFSFFFVSPGLHTLRFTHPSTLEVGVYDALIGVNSSLNLDVVLHFGEGETGAGTWRIREQPSTVPAVEQPERLVTARQIESLPSTGHLESFLNQTEVSVVSRSL